MGCGPWGWARRSDACVYGVEMGRRRGFFAEMQHQAAVAQRERERAQAAAVREQLRAQREAERAFNAAQRARAAAAKADVRAAAEAEREAKQLHIAAQESKVAAMNAQLEMQLAEIDSILEATLKVDDYVDLEKLRKSASHPPFESKYQAPVPPPAPIQVPPEPVFVQPEAPKGLSALTGKKKHAGAVAAARAAFEEQHRQWQAYSASIPMRQLEQLTAHTAAEEQRLQSLALDRARYDKECQTREAEVDAANAELDVLIHNFQAGKQDAVTEYVGIVFGNSVYPDSITWAVDYEYDQESRELRVSLTFPQPEDLPTVRQYKYVKAKDEIAESPQTLKEQRDRYSSVVENMVLRTLHEVWESDREGKIDSISLAGGVAHIDPATGQETFTPLIAVAVDRATFGAIDLARVTPAETLKYLKAVLSKNPHALARIDTSAGVRGH
ncbi:restriction system protein [Kribbella sp. VKM Ac-2527]|uniref:Restriction system protein n=2 Tax=Kribbella caucasensis TaxID=2512215 RepID=A0A4R6K7A7_9ACTN|nr:restriction system protein [Kribbella sp. VKM Ac-2527]